MNGMKNWKSALVLFVSIFMLYTIYMWFVKENHDVLRVLLESVVFSGILTILSTCLDMLKGKVFKK